MWSSVLSATFCLIIFSPVLPLTHGCNPVYEHDSNLEENNGATGSVFVPRSRLACRLPSVPNSEELQVQNVGNLQWKTVLKGSFIPGTYLRVICHPAYRPFSTQNVFCDSNGNWNALPSCVPNEIKYNCTLVSAPAVTNGFYKTANYTGGQKQMALHGEKFAVGCNEGYRISGSSDDIECINGKWLAHGTCEQIFCGDDPIFENAIVYAGGSIYGSMRIFHCHKGYEPSDAPIIRCNGAGQWESRSRCLVQQDLEPRKVTANNPPPAMCGPVPELENGHVSNGSFEVGTKRAANCNEGFQLLGGGSVECRQDLKWHVNAFCERDELARMVAHCHAVPEIENGRVDSGGYSIGDTRLVSCDYGYKWTGPSDTTLCQRDGSWSVLLGFCVKINCTELPSVQNGFIDAAGGSGYGSSRLVICKIGYHVNGVQISTITCEVDGTWTTPRSCMPIDCGPPPPVDGGFVEHGDGATSTFGTILNVRCLSGYRFDSGPSTVICQANNTWSAPGFCSKISSTCAEGEIQCANGNCISQPENIPRENIAEIERICSLLSTSSSSSTSTTTPTTTSVFEALTAVTTTAPVLVDEERFKEFSEAVQSGDVAKMALLLAAGPIAVNWMDGKEFSHCLAQGEQPLISAPILLKAVSCNTSLEIIKILVDAAGAHVDAVESSAEKRSALFMALNRRNIDLARFLIDHGADVNWRSPSYWYMTLLMFASYNGDVDAVRLLLSKGATVNAVDSGGWSALIFATNLGQPLFDGLGNVIFTGHSLPLRGQEMMQIVQLLLDNGAIVNAQDNGGSSALLKAAFFGYTAVVNLLLSRGANINLPDNHGRSPLMAACGNSKLDTCQLLLRRGANRYGCTHYYCQQFAG